MEVGDRVFYYEYNSVRSGIIEKIKDGLHFVKFDGKEKYQICIDYFLYTIDRKSELIGQIESDIRLLHNLKQIIKGVETI